ncbi:MAG: ABC transporter permease, partial [Mesorhizobium sp.]
MITYLGRRASHSILSVIGLLTLVFFLTRLTGDPSALY